MWLKSVLAIQPSGFLDCKTQPEIEHSAFDVYVSREASRFTPHHHCCGIGFN